MIEKLTKYTLKDYADPVMRIEIDEILGQYDVDNVVSFVVGASLVWFDVHDLKDGRPYAKNGEIATKMVNRKKVH